MNYLLKFRKDHNISKNADLQSIEVAVNCVGEANSIAYEFMLYIDNKTHKDGFVLHSHLNMLGRIFEQTEGMLVSIATDCPTSAEALGRVVVEGSVNLMYMTLKGNEQTLVGFFEAWLVEHKRKLGEWKDKITDSAKAERTASIIEERISLADGLENFLDNIVLSCDIERKPYRTVWPKSIYKRFSALDREADYYTSYHRLSTSSHLSGEDTLLWLFALNMMDNKHRLEIAKEAISYSIMMSRVASLFFIDAAMACSGIHGFKDLDKFEKLKSNLTKAILEISNDAGVPTF